ncbi:flagellin [Marinagarivorans cellulosilyticus]|uniref:Flagellin n=1 Tax=Marinagarivorans cellulosilyticus TaxID=2721545 RepID=A0AAN1WKI9_9GAMM|nr:flagellin [Marinagarivorans cellulosilyticus]BCD99295.1 flagellin [Marinagarivorans cellulosilyticus]
MPLVINTNIASLNAQRQLVNSGNELSTAMERLSSGKRINTAADDAAGLAISNRMTAQVRGLNQAVRNANDGISLIQTAEGALDETTNILQRMRELAIQSANGIYDDSNRKTLDAEVQQLISELDRIAQTTTFNGQTLLDGSLGNVELQVGSQANQTIEFNIQAMDAKTLGMGSVSVDVLGSEITSTLSSLSLDESDIQINGQSIGSFDGSSDTFQDLIDGVNDNVLGVEATGYTSLEGTTVGDGVLENGNKLQITLVSADGSGNNVFNITDTDNLAQLAEKISTVTGGAVSADIDDSGQLIISNNSGSTIEVMGVDATGSSNAAAEIIERATGFNTYDGAAATTDQAYGQIILTSEHGDPITVSRGATGTLEDLQNLGFRESDEAGVVKGVGLGSTGAAQAWNVGDLTINGIVIDNDDTDSLQGKVNAINEQSADSGVVAQAFASLSIDISTADLTVVSAAADNLTLNGVTIDLGLSANATASDIVDGFNANTDLTGVTARLSGTRIMLESDQGSINITSPSANSIIASGTALAGANFQSYITSSTGTLVNSSVAATSGLSLVVEAGLKLVSTSEQPISIELGDNADPQTLGLIEANSTAGGRFGTAIASVSVDTVAKAQKAIGVVDNALDAINDVRSQLGAVNNRLDFTINNLLVVSENTSAAKSRIMDADFAAETAALSRAQVLQQASQAMLAQANAASQQVLQLLQG